MVLETRFNLGHRVWGISSSEFRVIVKCELCSHTGKVTIGAEEFVCPKCSGRATRPQYAGRKWYISTIEAVVGQVRVCRTYEHVSYDSDSHNVNEYMLDETGVGSGTIWKEETLFASRAMAQAECDKLNGLLLAEDTSAITLEALI